MKFKLLLTVLKVFIVMTMTESSNTELKFNTHFPKVVLFGDSLTQVRSHLVKKQSKSFEFHGKFE